MPTTNSNMTLATRLTTRYLAAIRWFIPPEVRADAATLTRAQNVINAVFMAALSGPFYAYTYHALGYSAAGRVILTCCICMFGAPFLLRLTKSIVVAREVFLCAVFFNFSWLTYAMGGVSAPTAGWMVVPPMVALFLGGFATSMFWLLLTCVTVVFIYALPLLGIPLPAHPIEEMRLLFLLCDFGLYLVIVLFVFLFELTRTEGVVKLQHALDFIHDAALRDPLTGGHTRRHAHRWLEEQREDGAVFSICLLEIDGFRRINAGHGEAIGDGVLRAVAQCVARQLPEGGSFGRYGGAQFLLILPGTAQHDALLLAERVRLDVRKLRLATAAPDLAVTVSIGVAQFEAKESVGQTIARADEALYQATSGARDRVLAYGDTPALPGPDAGLTAPDLFDHTRIDPLTGLLGRRVLRDRLGHAMARALRNGRMAGVMLLGVDQLDDIRQACGIAAADALLVQVAAQVRDSLHAADTVIHSGGHAGGQFVVILEDLRSSEGARQVAHSILDRFTFPLAVDGHDRRVTLSIGIAMYPAPGCQLDDLLERAESAMTRARLEGGNGIRLYAADAARAVASASP
jgi:diguanylate cyclase (GGDEF)-like protein